MMDVGVTRALKRYKIMRRLGAHSQHRSPLPMTVKQASHGDSKYGAVAHHAIGCYQPNFKFEETIVSELHSPERAPNSIVWLLTDTRRAAYDPFTLSRSQVIKKFTPRQI